MGFMRVFIGSVLDLVHFLRKNQRTKASFVDIFYSGIAGFRVIAKSYDFVHSISQ